MKLFDRSLLREFFKFVALALLSVVAIYVLIDLFEELGYFMNRKVPILILLQYYLYFSPSAIDLLYPVSFVLACFMVYGQLTRHRELAALQSAGVSTYRLFLPILVFGVVSIPVYFFGRECVTIPSSIALEDMKRYKIEHRAAPGGQSRKDMNYLADDGKVFYAQQFETKGVLRNFIIVRFDRSRRRVVERIDGKEAVWQDGRWHAQGVNRRQFPTDTTELLAKYDSLVLEDITETPQDFAFETRPVEQMPLPQLTRYAERMRKAGYRTDKEMVEVHYRYAYPLTGLILLIMALPLAVQLRRGGVLLGLGLGMLFSFLYWCAIQGCRAFGQAAVLSPFLSAWLPNWIFLLTGLALMPTVRR
jgi:lipopolysaccharide export system permease protein